MKERGNKFKDFECRSEKEKVEIQRNVDYINNENREITD